MKGKNNAAPEPPEIARTYKDSVFVTIFHDKAKLIELYNALFDTDYDENMPLRDLLYISTVLKRMIDSSRLYREKKLMIPRPRFIIFYNGTKDFPAYQELKLSDSFLGKKQKNEEDALQLIVQVYNINTERRLWRCYSKN